MQKSQTMPEISPSTVASSAPTVAHTDALPAGVRLHEFEILDLLGVGGFGMVYRAYDHSLQRTVAIKEYMPSALAGRVSGHHVSIRSSGDQETYQTGLKSFVAEARLLAQFDHPSLVKVYRFWEANNTAYMVMPLYSGMTFRQARSLMQSPPPEDWLRKVLWPILQALKYLHENKTVHRDVSPDNIFLQDLGPPVLLDLGAARRAITDRSHKHTAILKVNYAPIEQYADAVDMQQGPWTDLYSLAAVVHGCLCNKPPLPATFRVLRDRLPTFASVTQTVHAHFGLHYSAEFVRAIEHALAIQPQDRPQDVPAFLSEMALQAPVEGFRFAWREGLANLQAPHPESAVADAVTQPRGAASDEVTQKLKTLAQEPTHPHALEKPLDDGASLTSDSLFPDTAIQTSRVDFPSGSGSTGGRSVASGRKIILAAAAAVLLAGFAYWGLKSPASVASSSRPGTEQAPVLPKKADTVLPQAAPPQAAEPDTRKRMASPQPEEPKTRPWLSVVPPPSPAATPVASRKPEPATAKPATVDALKARPDAADLQASLKAQSVLSKAGPEEVCANTNFLLRPMCHFKECEKPEFYALPFCVESRKHWQDSAKLNKP